MMKRNAGSIWKRAMMTALLMVAMTVLCTCNMEFKPEERILSIEPSTKHLELKENHYELTLTKEILKKAGLESVDVIFLKAPKDNLPITHEDLEILDAQGNSGAVKVIAGKKDQRLTLRYSGKEMKLSADVGIEVVYENNYSIKERNLSVRLEGPDSSVDINDIGILINGDGNKALTVTEGALSEITLLGPDKDDSRVIKSDELKARTRILSSEENRKVSSGASRDIEWLYSGEDYDVAFRTTVSYTAQDMLLKVEPSVASVTLAGFSESLDVTNLSQLSAGHEGVTHKVESGVSSFKAVYSITGEKDIPAEAWANIKNEAGSTAVSTGETKDITFSYTDGAGLSAAFTVSVRYEAIVSTPDIDEEPAGDGYKVKLSSATGGCEIWYTTDGTEPSRGGLSSTLYTVEFNVEESGVTVKAIGWKEGWRLSEVRTLVLGTGRLDRPVFDKPDGFTAAGELTVSISGGEGETIKWETQSGRSGSGPSPQSVSLDRNDTISAVARKDGFKDSFKVSRSYKVQVLKPEGLIEDIEGGRKVKLSTATAGAVIYYTTKGEAPTSSSTPYPEGGIDFTDAVSYELKAVAVKENLTDSDIYEQTVTVARADSPSFNPVGREYDNALAALTISGVEGSRIVWYVNDVQKETPEDNPFNVSVPSPGSFTDGTVVRAYARKVGFADSDTVQQVYGFKAAKPSITPDSETPTTLNIKSNTASAVIMVASSDTESEPDESLFTQMTGSSHESENGKWVWAFARRDRFKKSDVAVYKVDADLTPPPRISPEPGTDGYEKQVTVTISAPAGLAPDTVKLSYRLGDDGVETPITDGGTLTISKDGVRLYAWAKQTGKIKSQPAERTYKILAQAPTIGEPENIIGGKRLRITAPEGVTVYYTTDGTEPDSGSPNSIAGGTYEDLPLTTVKTHTIKARSYADSVSPSRIAEKSVEVSSCEAPAFNPTPQGTYSEPQEITISHSGGGDIYYAKGQSDPGKDNYIKLTGNPITLSSTSNIYAFARQMGKADSDVADSGRYVFALEAPRITEEDIPGGKKISIIAPSGSGVVRYTKDGQNPSSSTPDTVTAGQTMEIELKSAGAYTFKAKFFADDGVSDSFVTEKTITVIQLQSPEINVTPAPWEGDKYDDSVTVAFQSPNATGYLYTTGAGEPDTEGNNVIINQSSTIKVKARGMGYADSPIANRTFTLKLQKPTITEKEKIDEGIIYTISCASQKAGLYYSTGGGSPNETVPQNGEVTVTDSATLKAVAKRDGFADSDIVSQSVNIPVSDNVTFNLEGGTYNEEKTVTLSAADGAKIYYTTDNTEPSPNTGTTVFYNSPIAVNKSMTIKVIAIEPGKKRSAVQESAYTLKAPKLKESEIEDGKTQITVKAPSGFTVKYKKQGAANWTIYASPFDKEIGKTYIFILTREGWIDGVEKTKVAERFPYEVVEVEGGTMKMRRGGIDDVDVTLTGFFMGKYEVTQELYEEVMENNEWNFNNKPSSFSDNPASGENQKKRPVETVRWYDAVAFANQLSKKNGFIEYYILGNMQYGGFTTVTINPDANGYRLPTMDEWEYAARGGTLSRGYIYAGGDNPDAVAWYSDNSGGKTHEVGKKAANELGLYDMSGNVYEWCWDETGGSFSYNYLRGGSWESPDYHIKSSHVGALSIPSEGYNTFGIRLVRSLD
ncbi:MAG: chitobiase/beta-hexosaminidase C-terminal domain-containing protein [Sphaerochaeta sp.]